MTSFEPFSQEALLPPIASLPILPFPEEGMSDPPAQSPSRRSRKRKLLLPASTRKINREAQQRFRLKQKVFDCKLHYSISWFSKLQLERIMTIHATVW